MIQKLRRGFLLPYIYISIAFPHPSLFRSANKNHISRSFTCDVRDGVSVKKQLPSILAIQAYGRVRVVVFETVLCMGVSGQVSISV